LQLALNFQFSIFNFQFPFRCILSCEIIGMRRQLTLTNRPIDEAALLSQRQMLDSSGAVVCFVGVVRGREEGVTISGLEYEAFARMAEHQLQRVLDELEKRWPVESVRLMHRLGAVKAGEAALWVEVIAPHRAETFAACQWLIDELKRFVPIWKKPLASG
jgi:molybdopterin synthase catalytic subunit